MNSKPIIHTRRYIALLEVLIAFAITALCILPLVYSQIIVVKSERKFLDIVELDHAANQIYAEILQKLYEKKIPLSEIENGKETEIDQALLEASGVAGHFPFIGSYRFVLILQKPPEPQDKILSLYSLIFTFTEKSQTKKNEKPIKYDYRVFIEHRLK
jgi:hypothetical protein